MCRASQAPKLDSNFRIKVRLKQPRLASKEPRNRPGPATLDQLKTQWARPSLPLTYRMSPGRAPERVTASPRATSPITVMLIETVALFVVSPPASRIPSCRAARPIPRRNSSSHFPVQPRRQRESQQEETRLAPMAARSLVARTSDL